MQDISFSKNSCLRSVEAVVLINFSFKKNTTTHLRFHKHIKNLMQIIYQIIYTYFEDDYADALINRF